MLAAAIITINRKRFQRSTGGDGDWCGYEVRTGFNFLGRFYTSIQLTIESSGIWKIETKILVKKYSRNTNSIVYQIRYRIIGDISHFAV